MTPRPSRPRPAPWPHDRPRPIPPSRRPPTPPISPRAMAPVKTARPTPRAKKTPRRRIRRPVSPRYRKTTPRTIRPMTPRTIRPRPPRVGRTRAQSRLRPIPRRRVLDASGADAVCCHHVGGTRSGLGDGGFVLPGARPRRGLVAGKHGLRDEASGPQAGQVLPLPPTSARPPGQALPGSVVARTHFSLHAWVVNRSVRCRHSCDRPVPRCNSASSASPSSSR